MKSDIRNCCIRCAKEYVRIPGQDDFFICSECERLRPHRLDKVIPTLCGIISIMGEELNANFVELNIDGLFLRIQKNDLGEK